MGIYLLIVQYGSEAERKRLEYLLDKWRSSLRIDKPSGAVLFIDANAEDMLKFMEELYSKIPKDKVSIYQLKEPEFHLEPLTLEGIVQSRMSVKEAWGAVNLVLARLKGTLLSETSGEMVYSISSRKGVCSVRISIVPDNKGSTVRFMVEGYGEAVIHVYNRLIREFSYIGEVEHYE